MHTYFESVESEKTQTMVVVYIDLEYTNSNSYLGDVVEIAAIGGKSGWIFHKYINIGYKLPPVRAKPASTKRLMDCPVSYDKSSEAAIGN